MPQFNTKFPERDAMPPVMAGEVPWNSATLPKLRRVQLVNLAKAFDIKVNPDATKNELLVMLVAAEQMGAFRKPVVDPYYYARASVTPDDDPIGPWTGPPPLDERRAALADTLSSATKKKLSHTSWQSEGQKNFRHLQFECRQRGIICGSKTADWMRKAIRDYDEIKTREAGGVPSDDKAEDTT